MTALQSEQATAPDEFEVPATTLWDALFDDRRLKIYYQDPTLKSQVYTLSDQEGGARHRVSLPRAAADATARPLRRARPGHVGTPSERSAMARLGEHHGRARLTSVRVLAIRAWAAPFLSRNEIPPWTQKAKIESVSEGTLRDIVFRRTWTHV